MEYAEYLHQITFTLLQPEMNAERLNPTRRAVGGRARFELLNTRLPGNDIKRAQRLAELLAMPRMSTLAIAAIVDTAVSLMPRELCFVNVGVWHGFSLLSAMVNNPDKTCIGIDNFSQFGAPRQACRDTFSRHKTSSHFLYEMDYEIYLRTHHKGRIGVYFYDGNHSYDDQLEGLRLAEPFFADDCIVIVDDTNWTEPREATLAFIAQSTHSYDLLLDVSTCHNCHPTFWNGLMVLRLGCKPSGTCRKSMLATE